MYTIHQEMKYLECWYSPFKIGYSTSMASVNPFKFFVTTSIFCSNSMKQFIQSERVLQLSWVTQIESQVFNMYLARLRDETCSKRWQWLSPTYKTKKWLRIMYNRVMAIHLLLHRLQPVTRCLLYNHNPKIKI